MGRSEDDEPLTDTAEESRELEERAAILKRRAKFVASALAGLSLAASCSDAAPPGACLKMSPPDEESPTATGSGSATPPVSATASAEPPDAGVDAGEDAGADSSASSSASAPPQPCLEMAPPRPCLKVAPPPRPCLRMAPKPCLDMAPPDE